MNTLAIWNNLFLPCEIVQHWQTYHSSYFTAAGDGSVNQWCPNCECSHSSACCQVQCTLIPMALNTNKTKCTCCFQHRLTSQDQKPINMWLFTRKLSELFAESKQYSPDCLTILKRLCSSTPHSMNRSIRSTLMCWLVRACSWSVYVMHIDNCRKARRRAAEKSKKLPVNKLFRLK